MKPIGDETQKYKKSEFHFKSPHWKGKWAHAFNRIAQAKGDPRVLPGKVPYGEGPRAYRETIENIETTREIVDELNKFMALKDFTNIELLEKTLPLRYVFVLPARHGIVIYSAYTFLITKEKGTPASYKRVRKYFNLPDGERHKGIKTNYYVYGLLSRYFKLFTLSKPFRCLLNLEVRFKGSIRRRNKTQRMLDAAREITLDHRDKMSEWEEVSSPGLILSNVHKILLEHGFLTALQYVRYIFRASGLIRTIMLGDRGVDDLQKIQDISSRYLNIPNLLKLMGSEDPDNMDQSNLKDFL